MSTFNPDEFLNKTKQNSSGGFDPDAFLAKTKKEGPSVGTSAIRQAAQGFTGGFSDEIAGGVEAAGRAVGLDGLGGPMKNISMNPQGPSVDMDVLKQAYQAGRDHERQTLKQDSETNPGTSLVANIVGGAVSPINKIAKGMSVAKTGAALGGVYGLGTSEADSVGGMALDTATGAATGGILGKGLDQVGKAIAPAAQSFAQKVRPAAAKLNKDEILQAADKLGIKVTPGMLDDTGFVERLESSLAKSPSFFGQRVAERQRAVTDVLSNAVKEVTSESTNLSPFQVGEKFKSGVTAKVGERLDPISSVFNEVAESTKHIPIREKSIDAITRNIEADDLYSLGVGSETAKKYVNALPNLKNANQVKSLMTALNEDLRAAQGSDKQVLGMIKDKLSRLENNSILRSAIESSKNPKEGQLIGKEIVGDLLDARKGYASLAQDVKSIGKDARIKGNNPNGFLSNLEDVPSERVQDKFFNVENNRALTNLKEKFPEQFDLLRQGKLKDISDAAVDNTVNGQGRVSTQRFLNEVRNLNPEAKDLLFKEAASKIDDISTVQKSLPRNFNPSGTASEQNWHNVLYANGKDSLNYLLYKGASTNLGKKVGSKVAGIGEDTFNSVRDVTASGVKKLASPAARMMPEQFATKGPEKWMAVGANKLQEHENSGFTPEQIEKIKKTKKGRELLIEASSMAPNSKAMNKIIEQIRSGSLESGE